MATRRYKSKKRVCKKSKKVRRMKRRGAGIFGRDKDCYLGYDNVKRIVDNDSGGRVSVLSSKCNCRPESQKSTCINLSNIQRNNASSSEPVSLNLKDKYY